MADDPLLAVIGINCGRESTPNSEVVTIMQELPYFNEEQP